MISWFRHGQQRQLSSLELSRGSFSGKSDFGGKFKSPERPVGLDDHLVLAVGDAQSEGTLLVAALELGYRQNFTRAKHFRVPM